MGATRETPGPNVRACAWHRRVLCCGTHTAGYARPQRSLGTLQLTIVLPDSAIDDFCQRWRVFELALFGSALREDSGPDCDLDLLVSFAADAHWTLFDLVTMQQELERIVGRNVDLLERQAVECGENYIRRRSILSAVEVIYAA